MADVELLFVLSHFLCLDFISQLTAHSFGPMLIGAFLNTVLYGVSPLIP
jgi:hypothetical protein